MNWRQREQLLILLNSGGKVVSGFPHTDLLTPI